MRIFNLKFRQPISIQKEKWGEVALVISLAFEGLRKELYAIATETLSKTFYESKLLPCNDFSDKVQGINLRAFQLYLASYFLSRKKYIPAKYGKQFADLLWAQVLGNQVLEGLDHMKDLQPESGSFPRIYKFFCLLAADITGELNPAEGMLLMDDLSTLFVNECFLVVAHAFGDTSAEVSARREMDFVQNIIEEMKARFLIELEAIKDRQ